MEAYSQTFPSNVKKALADRQLQYSMTETGPRFIAKRSQAREALQEDEVDLVTVALRRAHAQAMAVEPLTRAGA